MEFCKSLGVFTANDGIVYPIKRKGFSPYQLCSESIKKDVIDAVKYLWPFIDDAYILKNYPGGNDVFYIYSFEDKVIGCVSVDRSNFHPYISNLFVVPDERGKGKSIDLLVHAEIFIEMLGFDMMYLWCDQELVQFYENKGWFINEDKKVVDDKTIYIMKKNI